MRYQELRLHPLGGLSGVVETIWTLESDGPHADGPLAPEPVIPDGRPEIIVHFGDPFDRGVPQGFDHQPSVLAVGQLTGPMVLRPGARVSVLGIRLRPEGATALWNAPQHEIAGRVLDPHVLSPPLAAWLGELRDRFDSAEAAAPHVAGGLRRLVRTDHIDARVARAVDRVIATRGLARVDDVADHAGCTRRHLERLFLDQVGLTPKRLSRIRRFQWALATLGETRSGLVAATTCGYADQAHFVHEFREMTGATPSSDLLQRAALTGLFLG